MFVIFMFTQIDSQMISSTLAKARRTQSLKQLSYESSLRPVHQMEPSTSLTLTCQQTNLKISSSLEDASAIIREETAEQRISSSSADASAIMREEIADRDHFSNINLNEGARISEIVEPSLPEGVYKRVRNSARQQLFNAAIGTAIGLAIGAGGIQLSNIFTQITLNATTTTAKPTPTTSTAVPKRDPDGITNNI